MEQKGNFYNIPSPFSFYQHKTSIQIVMLVGYFKITNCQQVKHITATTIFEKQITEILNIPHSILQAIPFTPKDSG